MTVPGPIGNVRAFVSTAGIDQRCRRLETVRIRRRRLLVNREYVDICGPH